MITIDGSAGEGGGQILRTAVALALCERRPCRIVNIRAGRSKPGLRPQHLAAVRAAAEVSGAEVRGAALNGQELTFVPGDIKPGSYRFAIGTAGSTSLVLQTVLPALLTASAGSELLLEGGTHNPRAPTFDFLARAYLPLIERMGPRVAIELERVGFEPAGGGRVRVRVSPAARLEPLHLEARGATQRLEVEVLLSKLPRHIAEREATVLRRELDLGPASVRVRLLQDSPGPGNAVSVFAVCEELTEVFTAFGRRGVPAESVAQAVVGAAKAYLSAGVPVGVHLADQLLLPFALAGAGSFMTMSPSRHTLTNIEVVRRFFPLAIECRPAGGSGAWRVAVRQERRDA
jgi:RNA 3'-terminal phosphate cyclase (ATP)